MSDLNQKNVNPKVACAQASPISFVSHLFPLEAKEIADICAQVNPKQKAEKLTYFYSQNYIALSHLPVHFIFSPKATFKRRLLTCFLFYCSVDDVVMSLYCPMNHLNVKECVSLLY